MRKQHPAGKIILVKGKLYIVDDAEGAEICYRCTWNYGRDDNGTNCEKPRLGFGVCNREDREDYRDVVFRQPEIDEIMEVLLEAFPHQSINLYHRLHDGEILWQCGIGNYTEEGFEFFCNCQGHCGKTAYEAVSQLYLWFLERGANAKK